MPEQHYSVESYRAQDSIGYLLRRLHNIWLGRFELVLGQAGMTLTQWIALIRLRDGAARTAADIARCMQHDSGALTRVLDQLERRGLIVRRRSAQDRRVVELELTAAGRRAVADLLPIVVEQTNLALQPLTKQEFRQFKDMLVRVLDHVQHDVPPLEPAAPLQPDAKSRRRGPPQRGTKRPAHAHGRGHGTRRGRG